MSIELFVGLLNFNFLVVKNLSILKFVPAKAATPAKFNSRIVQKYDLSTVSESIVDGTIGLGFKAYLNLHTFEEYGIPYDHEIYAYPLSQSFSNGTGRKLQSPKNFNGVSWQYRNYSTTTNSGDIWATASFASTSTGSFTENAGGGTWYTSSAASQSFSGVQTDVRMDVTDIVWKWLHGTVPNEGFMLKRSGSMGNADSNVEEGNNTKYGHFVFFGRDTNTIYQPKLEVVWDDSTWATGSLSPLTSDNLQDMVLYMRGLRPEYKEKSKVKFRVIGRERYPEKSYATSGYSTGYTTVKYLPSGSSYYQIRDAYTEDIIVPFGDGTKLSCDSTGNYFNLWMDGLQAERFYRVEYKIVSGSGTSDETVEFYDEKHSFKVVR